MQTQEGLTMIESALYTPGRGIGLEFMIVALFCQCRSEIPDVHVTDIDRLEILYYVSWPLETSFHLCFFRSSFDNDEEIWGFLSNYSHSETMYLFRVVGLPTCCFLLIEEYLHNRDPTLTEGIRSFSNNRKGRRVFGAK
jgi:hypothetical protein